MVLCVAVAGEPGRRAHRDSIGVETGEDTGMKELPITLHPHELAAAIAGTLRQVRRPVVPQPHEYATLQYTVQHPAKGPLVCGFACVDDAGVHMHDITCRCPFGQTGDVIWVKESWGWNGCMCCPHHYKATDPEWVNETPYAEWKPASTMPKSLSRISLPVRAVRVERTQSISTHDIGCCGINLENNNVGARNEYAINWNRHYARKGLAFEANPWQWVCELGGEA